MKSFGRRTSIDQYDTDMNFIKNHPSINSAAKSYGVTVQMISKCLRGVCKTGIGYIWKYSRTFDLEDECWCWYPLNDSFMVSNKGRVRTPTGRITIGCNVGAYRRIRTSNVTASIHRMVAITFLHQIPGKNLVNHIDHNPQNNCLDNLEWVDHTGNMRAAEIFHKNK